MTSPTFGTLEADPAEVGLDPARLARIDSHFRRYVDDGRLAGATIAVARHDRLAHLTHLGVRDLDSAAPVTDDTLWRIYSMTKPITSVAVLMLAERGALELTDPVSRYIRRSPSSASTAAARRSIRGPTRPSSRCGCTIC